MAVRKMITMNPQITIVDDTHFIIDEHHYDNLDGTSYLWSRSNEKRVRINNYRLAALADAVVERNTPVSFDLLYNIAKGYEVHHIDCDHKNNRLDNLVVVAKHDHKVIHQMLDDITRVLLKGYSDEVTYLIKQYREIIQNTKIEQRKNHNVFY